MLGVTHDAAMLYPARALGDCALWPKLNAPLLEWVEGGENEESLVPQWDASLRFDQRAALPGVKVPVHVIAFAEDVQAPPQDGEELARLIPGAGFTCRRGWACRGMDTRTRRSTRQSRGLRGRWGASVVEQAPTGWCPGARFISDLTAPFGALPAIPVLPMHL